MFVSDGGGVFRGVFFILVGGFVAVVVEMEVGYLELEVEVGTVFRLA